MAGLPQRGLRGRTGRRGWVCAVALLSCAGWAAQAHGQAAESSAKAWKAAVAAREAFEAEPVSEHTRSEFTQILDDFRAIYHGNPADVHAPAAVDQVAQLLAEQAEQLKDPKLLRASAGQYEFLARAYPASSLAAPGLGRALELLGPDGANDPAEAARVREQLRAGYPRSAAAIAEESRSPAGMTDKKGQRGFPAGMTSKGEGGGTSAGMTGKGEAREGSAGVVAKNDVAQEDERVPELPAQVERVGGERGNPELAPAMVTGIRHWSTASYTRVAIDLGADVQFQAARVEHPDRIFFDLHGARLVPGLAGKSFAITDDGFLKNIRAGQFGRDVARIVLDVQPVAEYSAFLLPNPTRLIIDIHGKQAVGADHEAQTEDVRTTAPPTVAEREQASRAASDNAAAAPVERVEPGANKPGSAPPRREEETTAAAAGVTGRERQGEVSTLPPMPVTDGSAGFGLPARRTENVAGNQTVARPRVVVPAKPTTAKPVPNSVTTATPGGNREIAAVSEGPGVIAATAAPTSKPVVERTAKPLHGSHHAAAEGETTEPGEPVTPAPLTAAGQATLMRALGLKIGRIVIDAGHGGHDSGTLGPDGIEEKDVVLDVALRLGKLLHDRLGAEVVYTRADDTFIPLETRTAIANKAQADLFISVHANSSGDPSARGVEVYYLNFTSDPEAMQVASRENAVSSQRVNQLSDLVKKIALKDKIDESRELAADVDTSLYGGLKKGNAGLKDRGVKKAPFVVLIGANMPSILAEISFVTNPEDASELRQPAYRERVAESLYSGVARYAEAINSGSPGRAKKALRTEKAALKQGDENRN